MVLLLLLLFWVSPFVVLQALTNVCACLGVYTCGILCCGGTSHIDWLYHTRRCVTLSVMHHASVLPYMHIE